MATKDPFKNTRNFVFKRVYLKNELGDPLESDWQAKMKLSAKFKKILCSKFKATFTIRKY